MARLSAAEKEKRKPKFLKNLFKGRRAKTDEAATKKGMAESAMKKKMYAAESMFKSKAKDTAKSVVGKARPFGSAFKSAKDSGKKAFLWKGKSYSTQTKSELESGSKMGKFKKRFDQTGKADSNKKEGGFNKFKSSKTLAEFFGKLKKKK
jgi:hypothetical protein